MPEQATVQTNQVDLLTVDAVTLTPAVRQVLNLVHATVANNLYPRRRVSTQHLCAQDHTRVG